MQHWGDPRNHLCRQGLQAAEEAVMATAKREWRAEKKRKAEEHAADKAEAATATTTPEALQKKEDEELDKEAQRPGVDLLMP